MIKIRNNKVYIEGNQTKDPVLIGLAVLDSLEENQISIKSKLELYFEENKLRRTNERKNLIEILSNYDVFDTEKLILDAENIMISRASVYNFISLLQDAEIITKKEHLFI